MKDWLLKLKRQKEGRIEEARKAMKASDSAEEVRSLGETIDALRAELDEIDERLAELEDGGDGGEGSQEGGQEEPAEGRSIAMRSYGAPRAVASAPMGNGAPAPHASRSEDPFDTEEYREAFFEYVTRGSAMPAEMAAQCAEAVAQTRADAITDTTAATAVIPTSLVRDIIAKVESCGNIYAKVTKTNVQGGVDIPVMDLKPQAYWISETSASDEQKLTADETVSFKYYGVECRIAQTLLASIVTIDQFQAKFPELAAEAIVKALEEAIVGGDGSGKPLGIAKDTRVTNTISLTKEELSTWQGWKRAIAKVPKAYRNGEWVMDQSTFDVYVDGMTADDGQPIARVNYGIDGGETYRFGGKPVETCELSALKAVDDASEGDVVAIFGKLSDYILNSNLQMTSVRWVDHDDNKVKNKCMMVCDGKVGDANGFLLVKLAATPAEPDSGKTE